MSNTCSPNNKIPPLQLESKKETFQQSKNFFDNLQYANQASVKFPALAKKTTALMKKTQSTNFISSLNIGSLLPNTQPTHKVFNPKHKIIFGTQKNENIDIRSIDFNKSISFFKNSQAPQECCLPSHSPHIFKNSTTVESNSIINNKQDSSLMSVSKINTPEVKFPNDFRLNRSASNFSNFIFEIKSTYEKKTRLFKNIFKKDNNEKLCVKFENGKAKIIDKATIARQDLIKHHNEINNTKTINNLVYTTEQKKLDLCNNYKTLLNEINIVESETNELIMEKSNIMDMVNSSELTDGRLNEINGIFNGMKSAIRILENYIDDPATNEQLTWDYYDIDPHNLSNETLNTQNIVDSAIHIINKSNSDIIDDDAKNELNSFFQNSNPKHHSSHESINSNSSGYVSENSVDSGYSSENNKKEAEINLITPENHAKSDNLTQKEKSTVKKYQPNPTIRHTKKSNSRNEYIKNKHVQNNNLSTITPANKAPNTKNN